jgi:hypothetical protein
MQIYKYANKNDTNDANEDANDTNNANMLCESTNMRIRVG